MHLCTYNINPFHVAKPERGDSGLYSEESNSNNECIYTSSCSVENKHFEVEILNKVESYEDFVSNLPLPVEELNHKTVRYLKPFIKSFQFHINSYKLAKYISQFETSPLDETSQKKG